MQALLVTGSDTGIGKTRVVAALARLLGGAGGRVQVVKVVETGVGPGGEGDAALALRLSGAAGAAFTLASFPAALSPPAAAAAAGSALSLEVLAGKFRELPACDWRICEGAGGIGSPMDEQFRDWADFAAAAEIETAVIVVPDRVGAINQARLAAAWAAEAGLRAGVWLNAAEPVDPAVTASNLAGLAGCGIPVWAAQSHGADLPGDAAAVLSMIVGGTETKSGLWTHLSQATPWQAARSTLGERPPWVGRCRAALAERDRRKLRRSVRVTARDPSVLDLAGNDYLELAHDPAVAAAVAAAAAREGTSASASPLITGWKEPHERLVRALCDWHGYRHGLLWSSGYAANTAVLGVLPRRGDLVLADRLIHHSMIAGLMRGEARLQRYPHLDLDRLEALLGPRPGCTFVVTESVFSMDGDYPDLARLADMKRRHGFCWILDEAHALGWYGPGGSGLARAAGVGEHVDILVGTLGKTLASGGAYTLFRDESVREHLVNTAGEFIYSTALPPANAAGAEAALARVRELSDGQPRWHAASRAFRQALREDGWTVPAGDSPIVPVRLDDEDKALDLAAFLRASGILAAAVRPPTVPAGTSRLRFSLKRGFDAAGQARVMDAMRAWRRGPSP